MTHVNILMVECIVSETQTDRQLKFIIDMYLPYIFTYKLNFEISIKINGYFFIYPPQKNIYIYIYIYINLVEFECQIYMGMNDKGSVSETR